MRRGTLFVAALVCLAIFFGAFMTLDEGARKGRIGSAKDHHPPTLSCPTGYDHNGRCHLRSLAGGIHGYLVPGLLAAFLAGAGGLLGGLALSIGNTFVARVVQVGISVLESLPRLGVLLLVYVLSQHSLFAFGGALGLLMLPGMAEEIAERVRVLESSDFIVASRAHGLSEGRVIWYHLAWLGCAPWIVRYMLFTFAYTLIAETSLSFVLRGQTSPAQISWGESLYETRKILGDRAYELGQALSSGQGIDVAWTWGLPQFFFTALAILIVLWATQALGDGIWTWLQGGDLGGAK